MGHRDGASISRSSLACTLCRQSCGKRYMLIRVNPGSTQEAPGECYGWMWSLFPPGGPRRTFSRKAIRSSSPWPTWNTNGDRSTIFPNPAQASTPQRGLSEVSGVLVPDHRQFQI
ncbi:hypothetical protein BDP55DRAFT_686579 [Colletotrichum godetiae]|uniref:Uncharacterized protein n=1 Tax=Colletotrichum godetiae TaxID=1209918 RepID=A0AAJ0A8Y8_9PEZI|nr:uncharacterized protein BDP55DRAFT_686579 [Colletotrichum godetiae]KAK1657187.1 hypothetical protein BDP55DRAFT_686579 [Colletotrichum godetiae]